MEPVMTNPLEIINKHFGFLITEYKFRVAKEEHSPDAMGNAYVTFVSASIGLRIAVDRGQVLLNVGSVSDKEKDWFDFTDVIAFFNSSVENPYFFVEKTDENTTEEIIEVQVKRLASLLQRDCKPMLSGMVLMKDKIKEIERRRVEKMLAELNKLSEQYKKNSKYC
jgi:hypothetical protein